MKSIMNHNFSQTAKASIPRSSFDRSHGYKTTFDAADLVPVFCDEVLPGDTFNLSMTSFSRLSTPLTPIMDNIFLDSFFFFVPTRLIWDNFQKFHGEQDNPTDSTSFLVPTMDSPVGGHLVGSLSDYMGIPTEVAGLEHISLFHRAYNLIWNEWFRDQNLQQSVTVDKDDGPDTSTDYALLQRGKRHDYFTSCLPWPQKGDEVTIPLGTTAPVTGIGKLTQTFTQGVSTNVYETGTTGQTAYAEAAGINWAAAGDNNKFYVEEDPDNAGYPGVFADLSSATAATINALRLAFQIQKLYERDARGGTRYTEIIKSHFGVTSPDSRLQRPEYLGGGSSPVNIHPVQQTSESSGTPQGTLTAFGTASQYGHGFVKSFTEHGVILGMVSARADLTYQQGLNRMFSRSERFDYFYPALAHIGEQAVLNKEIYADASANDELVFGYAERWSEYRYKPSQITGQFRSTYASSLDIWHLSQEFGSLPELNAAFITENPPIDRVIATPTEPHFIFDAYFNLKCARPMPTYSTPGLIDHF